MGDTRQVIQTYIEHFENKRYVEALSMLNEDGRYILIGRTPASGVYEGRKDMFDRFVPILGAFKEPPTLTFSDVIVEGNKGVIRASGKGLGNFGTYEQPYFLWFVQVENGGFSEICEYIDTVELETAVFGKKLIEPNSTE